MLVCGDVRRTFGEVRDAFPRTGGVPRCARGSACVASGPSSSAGSSGQDPVALVLHNGTEYIEAMLGAYRARAVPFNVNQHYRAAELGALLTDVGARAVVYHRSLRAAARGGRATTTDLVLIDVDDGSGSRPAAGQHRLRGGRGHAARRSAGSVARRSLPGLHRRDHRSAEGRALAPGRHLRLGDGGGRGGHRRVDRGRGRGRRHGAVVRRPAPHARRRAVDGLLGPPPWVHGRWSTTTPGPSTPAWSSRSIRARAGLHDVDRRRRLPPSPGGRAAHGPVRLSARWS